MNKQTQMLLLIGAVGVGLYLFTRKGGATGGGASMDPAVMAAQAQSQAMIAQAEAAAAIAKAEADKPWFAPIVAGVGASLPAFAGSLGSMFG